MNRHHYLAEAFEYHLRLLKHRDRELALPVEAPATIISGASVLLARFIAEARIIEVTTIRRKTLWIEKSKAESLIKSHATAFPASEPTETFWISLDVLEPFAWESADGFQVKAKEGSSTKALALLWEEFLADTSITDTNIKFEKWFAIADCLPHAGFDAPKLMTPSSREQYLTAAHKWLEKNHSADTVDYKNFPPPQGSSPIEFLVWGESIEVQRGRVRDFESEAAETIIGQIVKFDSRQASYNKRCERIRSLLTSGVPSVVCTTAERIHLLHPQAIPWILADHKTLSLGLALIEGANIPESFAWQSLNSEARTAQQERDRFQLWEKAVEIAYAVFAESNSDWTPEAKALTIHEITDYLFQKESNCERQKYFRPDIGNPMQDAVIQRRKHWLAQLALARTFTRIHRRNQVYSPRVFDELAEPLLALCSKPRAPKREQFEAMPYTELGLLLWILEEIKTGLSEKPELGKLSVGVSDTIANLYASELGRDKYCHGNKNYRVVWTSEADIWSNFKWLPVLQILQGANKLDRIIQPFDFEGAIRSLPPTNGLELHDIHFQQHPWARKIRTHLRLLLAIYHDIKQTDDSQDSGREDKNLIQAIEDEITDLIKKFTVNDQANGRVDIFDSWLESNAFGSSPSLRLIPLISKTINQFESGKRSQIIKAIQSGTSDLSRLIGLAGGLRSDGNRSEVESQITTALGNDPLKNEHWLTHIEQMALDSANSGLVDTARAILEHGDRVTEKHPYRDRWLESAFQIKLVLAFHEQDQPTLETLAIPSIQEKVKIYGTPSITERLEQRRKFLLAVLNIKNSPEVSAKLLEEFASTNDSLEYSVNLFCARIEVAKHVTGDQTQQFLKEAFDKWEKSKSKGLALLSDERKTSFDESIAFNEVECLILMHDQAGVLNLLTKVARQYRLSIPFLKLIVPFFRSEGMSSELQTLQDDALDFHKSTSGEFTAEWTEIAKLIQQPISPHERPVAPVSATIFQDRLRLLAQWYPQLRRATPQELVEVIRGKDWNVGRFLLKELISCLHLVIEQQVLFDQFPKLKETEQTLLLAILMKARLEEWGWSIPPESLGGETTTGATGRRDVVIEIPSIGKVSVIEALKLSSVDKTSILDHFNRLFSYDPIGDDCGFLVSFVSAADTNEFWRKYKDVILSAKVPDAPIVGVVEDLTDRDLFIGTRNKIGISNHQHRGQPKTIYHIAVSMKDASS